MCIGTVPPAGPWETDSVVMGGFLEEKGCFLRAAVNLEMRTESAHPGVRGTSQTIERFVLCLEGLCLKDPLVWT